jgi:hypothetical protein
MPHWYLEFRLASTLAEPGACRLAAGASRSDRRATRVRRHGPLPAPAAALGWCPPDLRGVHRAFPNDLGDQDHQHADEQAAEDGHGCVNELVECADGEGRVEPRARPLGGASRNTSGCSGVFGPRARSRRRLADLLGGDAPNSPERSSVRVDERPWFTDTRKSSMDQRWTIRDGFHETWDFHNVRRLFTKNVPSERPSR